MHHHETDDPMSLADLFRRVASMGVEGGLPDASTSEGRTLRAFFENNWRTARDGLLERTELIRVRPLPIPGPRAFSFEMDLPYKRKRPDGTVELDPGPIHGTIDYLPNVMTPERDAPSILVFVTSDGFYHVNYNRRLGALCPGHLPTGPFPLDALLMHIWTILSYQNMDSRSAMDAEAVRYFTSDPDAFRGVDQVPPLY